MPINGAKQGVLAVYRSIGDVSMQWCSKGPKIAVRCVYGAKAMICTTYTVVGRTRTIGESRRMPCCVYAGNVTRYRYRHPGTQVTPVVSGQKRRW